jgi:hypothetical protein
MTLTQAIYRVYPQAFGSPVTCNFGTAINASTGKELITVWVGLGAKPDEDTLLAQAAGLPPSDIEKRPRALAAIVADIQNLSAADKAKLQLGVQAQFLQDHPRFARALGINLDGDEVAP